jgi:hypothetical protein
MEIKEFADKVIADKNKTITDEVFLHIQNKKEFMQEYLQLVHQNGSQVVNQQIGNRVRIKYQLTDSGCNNEPKSTLILSHTEF